MPVWVSLVSGARAGSITPDQSAMIVTHLFILCIYFLSFGEREGLVFFCIAKSLRTCHSIVVVANTV